MKSLSPSFISIFSWSLIVAARVVCAGPTPLSNSNSQQLDEQEPNDLATAEERVAEREEKRHCAGCLKIILEKIFPADLEWFCAGGDDCVVWFPSRWGACSERCGEGGRQTRTVACYRVSANGRRGYVDDFACANAELMRPVLEQACNRRSCPEWAFGPWSTCSAQCGYEAKQYRSVLCLDANNAPLHAADCGGGAPSTDALVRYCTLPPCAGDGHAYTHALPVAPARIRTRNENKNNATFVARCAMTHFGCCPDSYTPARGEYFEGCPFNEYGSCDLSVFGCCADGVTLARGPNHEGCGRVPCWPRCCQATLFGCCPDQTTIALGPNYAGCDRSPVSCETNTTNFGCCADGQTVAHNYECV